MTSDRNGRILRDGDSATLLFERRLPYPVEAVWAALSDPDQRAAWFGQTTLDPRAGGAITMTADGPPVPPEHRRMHGRILVWEPPHVFEHEWHQGLIGQTTVRYELIPDGDGTCLRLTHGPMGAANAGGFIPGTHAYLDRLEAHLAGTAIPDWQQRFGEVAPTYPEFRASWR